jgi:hypothetical protein
MMKPEVKAWGYWQPERDFGETQTEILSMPGDLHTPKRALNEDKSIDQSERIRNLVRTV